MSKPLSSGEESYRESVETLARLQSSKVFNNGAPIHAAIIFDTFLRHATRSVKVFCKNLAAKVFDEKWLVPSAEKALLSGASISVVCQEPAENSVFREWLLANSSRPGVSLVEGAAAKGGPASQLTCNFAVMDGKAYRFEADANTINAVACMNDEALAGKLESIFARISG